eukprot:Hpha_TRINITY_DN16291_c2_g4::TRINITY_DN16291_c2_g4_i1::g.14155::m.14155
MVKGSKVVKRRLGKARRKVQRAPSPSDDEASVSISLSEAAPPPAPSQGADGGPSDGLSGLEAYRREHLAAYVPAAELQRKSNQFMSNFRQFEQEQVRKRKQMREEEDDEGWQVVGRAGTRAATSQLHGKTVGVKEFQRKKAAEGKKKTPESQDDFYAFNRSQKNMKRLLRMKKILRQSRDRRPSGASLRNFADHC